MSDLADKKCIPCEGGIPSFDTKEIHNYVRNGGNVIVQYNTSRGINVDDFAPYNFTISRNRTSQENSNVDILNKNHVALNSPN